MKKLFFLLAASIPVLLSCNDKKDATCELSSAAFAGNYKTTAVKYKASASAAEVDYYDVLFSNACEKDDYVTFNANGTYQLVDAGTVCVPSNNSSGSWSLSGNVLTVDASPGTIESFSCTSYVTRYVNVFTTGDVMIVTSVRQ